MNFRKSTSYAINILTFMAEHPEKEITAKLLHDSLKIPYQFLRQLMTSLSRMGYIKGLRGRNGGFAFAQDIDSISLNDIVKSTEGDDIFNKCIMGQTECPFDHSCPLHTLWEKARTEMELVMSSTSLGDLLRKKKQALI
jgi:Rrf2 family protein